ncbi:uncharacterized protein L969DRAFT_45611 [Mixia osmundae IAM 14324]|uniref:Secreted protein n=1 Tax=Mixia osmundae (strain CBS 9802 / IAM 14324 / JCM 22182 / KY 12970) TaxID=764103 RepID=G7DXU0_MIXOS|nr:uncharacterized protein L969DRAFT_45611 [Mixia osmundae IAM 14324]KEI41303.1 hypothetical protein L969DRAFT_45611 [Mixia osmundae IAM 14324]GAA95400.1 hypothetical protein E5Q_02054 [Mixia osmundae IAM 14324]
MLLSLLSAWLAGWHLNSPSHECGLTMALCNAYYHCDAVEKEPYLTSVGSSFAGVARRRLMACYSVRPGSHGVGKHSYRRV